MILKTLLILEAAAKVALIVGGSLTEKCSLLLLPGLNYNHVYRSSVEDVVRLAENYTLCGGTGFVPAFLFSTEW